MAQSATAPAIHGQLAFVLIEAGCLALPIALLLLALYRRAVTRAMAAGAHPAPTDKRAPNAESPATKVGVTRGGLRLDTLHDVELSEDAARLHTALVRGPWRLAAVYAAAGVAYAVVMTLFVLLASKSVVNGLRIAAITVELAWPAALSVCLVAAHTRRARTLVCAAYAIAYLGVSGIAIAQSSALTWPQLVMLWLILNVPATLLLLLFLTRRIRAVGPLVLALTIFAVLGAHLAFLTALKSDSFTRSWVRVGSAVGLGAGALLPALMLLGGALLGAVGWLVLRWLGTRYARGHTSDLTITLDSAWLVFAYSHGAVHLAPEGARWLWGAVAAFAAYKLVSFAGLRLLARTSRGVDGGAALRGVPMLLLLRVFALGRKSEQLFDPLTAHWRHVGALRLIAGPDLVTSTVEPHEFLDFLSGGLSRHFIDGSAALDQRLRDERVQRDHDGRFRVAEFFCRADTWKLVLGRLAEESDAVLMDLRGFTTKNDGCIYEIGALVDLVPFARVLLLVDTTTDEDFLNATIARAREAARATSPNRGAEVRAPRMLRGDGRRAGDVALLMRAISEAVRPAARPAPATHQPMST